MQFWCSKCRKKVDVEKFDISFATGSRGKRKFAKSKCPVCSTNVSVFMKGDANVDANAKK